MKIETTLEAMREVREFDWQEVFTYAGKDDGQYGMGVGGPPTAALGSTCSVEPFGLADVAEILGSVDGENDGDQWVAVGRLTDGRFFAIIAGCDYTGWD